MPNTVYVVRRAAAKTGVFMLTNALDYKVNPVISGFSLASWQISWDGNLRGNTIAIRHRLRANTVMYDGSVTSFDAPDFASTAPIWR